MMPKYTVPKLLCIITSIIVAVTILVIVLPQEPILIPVQGNSTVNTAAAIKISLAGKKVVKPEQFKSAVQKQQKPNHPTSNTKQANITKKRVATQPKNTFTHSDGEKPNEEKPNEEKPNEEKPNEETTSNQQQNNTGKSNANQHPVLLRNAGNASDVESYLNQLSRHIARHYKYPLRARQLRQEGTPIIVFVFQRDGSLISHSMMDSSGHKLLDQAALDMLAQAIPLPKVPTAMQGKTFTYALPVKFQIR